MAAAIATSPAALPDFTTPFKRKDKVVAAEDMPGIPEEVEVAVLDLIDRARRSKRRSRRTRRPRRAAAA